jgi:hypothetical protein
VRTLILRMALWTCAAAWLPARVLAEPWVVVPVVVATEQEARLEGTHAARPLAEALAEHARVVPFAAARERFETRGSSAPVAATHSDLDQIARDAQLALYHVAMGLYGTASSDVERVMQRADRALESLNRESLAARQLLDSCLFIVRARLQARKPEAARAQALECRRLVPDIEPEAAVHPPDVIGELAAAEATIEMQSPGSLRVTSEPSGCPVFIQGRNLGQTPLELPRLSRGEYRVQVECVPGQFGRVHRVTLGPSRTVVHVDSRFDSAVQSSDTVSLRYPNDALEKKYAATHAVEIGRAVGARYVALVMPERQVAGRVRITAFEVESGKWLASVLAALDDANALRSASAAAEALVAGRSLDFTVEPPAPLSAPVELEAPVALAAPVSERSNALSLDAPAQKDESGGPGVLAWSLGAVGAVAHVIGWGLYAQQLALEADYRKVRDLEDTAEAERRLDNIEAFELAPLLTAFGGSALMTASLPMLLPDTGSASPPVLGYVAGGAGVAIAGAGAYLLIAGGSCDRFDALGRCDDVPATTRLGAMLISASLPLLSIPIVYWVRGLGVSDDTAVALEGSHQHVLVRWRGRL